MIVIYRQGYTVISHNRDKCLVFTLKDPALDIPLHLHKLLAGFIRCVNYGDYVLLLRNAHIIARDVKAYREISITSEEAIHAVNNLRSVPLW